MQIRIANNCDEEQWDNFVSKYPMATAYHRFAWKKSIENAYGHQCFYFIAEDKHQQIVGVLPTVSIKPFFFTGQLSALPFCDLGESIAVDKTIQSSLIEAAEKLAVDKGLKSFEYRATAQQEKPDDTIPGPPSAFDQKVRMLLDLPESAATLLSGFKSKLRSQIKKAEKNGLTFETGRSNRLIDEFYDVFSHNMRDLGSPTHSKHWFIEIKNNFKHNMIISVIKYQGQSIGAGIVLFNGFNASIPWASTKRAFNHLSPNMLLYWSLLQYAADNEYKSFDFGRSTPGEGTYKFKQQWGARPIPLIWKKTTFGVSKAIYNKSHNPGRIRNAVESIWRLLPLGITIYFGPKIRKYISL